MKKRSMILAIALAFALCLGLTGCFEPGEPAVDENGHSTPVPDMSVVSDGSYSAIVVEKADDGITLEITNSGNDNVVSATFTSAKMGGREYVINQATYADSPLSIMRVGEETKTVNLQLPPNDFARIKISSRDIKSADEYDNVDLTYTETYMGDNGTITKSGRTISVKNA